LPSKNPNVEEGGGGRLQSPKPLTPPSPVRAIVIYFRWCLNKVRAHSWPK